MPSCLSWSFWTRKHKANKHNTDYVYLQWHFMTSQHHQNNVRTDQSKETPVPRADTREEKKYADIHSWLDSLPDTVCTEIYCDCCDVLPSTTNSTPNTTSSSSFPCRSKQI